MAPSERDEPDVEILHCGDPRLPRRESATVRGLLELRSARHPDRVFAMFPDGTEWTYAQTWHEARRAAAGLAKLGVGPGDRVLSWLPNGKTILRTWFGANLLGATHVPINTAYRGSLLRHVVVNADAKVAVVHPDLAPLLDTRTAAAVQTIVDDCPVGEAHDAVPADAEPWDAMTIVYTSGTTGPSKGVLSSYAHNYSSATAAFADRAGPAERFMVNLPIFHAGGTLNVYSMLLFGGSVVLIDGFETAGFWSLVRRTGTTSCTLLGVMADFLLKQPADPADRNSGLRWVWMVPYTGEAAAFADRFAVDVYTMFTMTEISCPLVSGPNPPATGSCGRPRAGVEVRLVDAHDVQVAPGEAGELVVRTNRPWSMNHGYHAMPEATATAWRNGWFHTGDAMRVDADGFYYFVDRLKDCIRRRGENISSFEVEAEALAHPQVREAAVVGVAAPGGEQEVLLFVAPTDGSGPQPDQLLAFLSDRLPHFMVPRYIRVLPTLPKTPTNKVRKHLLRDLGVSPDTWDREQAGMTIKRRRLR